MGSAFNVYGPEKLSEMTDIIQEGIRGDIDLGAIKNIGIILVVLYGLGLVFNYIQGFIMATVTQKITKKCVQNYRKK